ncbi:MAG: transglycosylase domain-containing protein [Deltaproteobacteria bacterium]|nr:transglycosylase domain-containing protein [Deltaproteobacteria bacterium]
MTSRLEGRIWSEPGRVLSAPISLWPGLACTASELSADLRAAGYDPVTQVREPGDFVASADAVQVRVPAARGPGWSVPAADVRVTFRQGRVRSVTPSSPARFAPAVLATVAGPGAERRHEVPLAEIPPLLRKAVLAMEDTGFYTHRGISARGILRALWVDLAAGEAVQGGSTITQQLAKNLFLDSRRTVARKFREALLALALERRLSKDEIFELYLNGVYLGQAGGQAIHGVAEAARVTFGTSLDALTPGQCATLAGIIAAPGAWSPLRHPDQALERRNVALHRLVATGALDEATARREAARPLGVVPTGVHREADWAVDHAIEVVEAETGPGTVSAGREVHTTIQPVLQRLAERAVAEGLAQVEAAHPSARDAQAALVALDPHTGEILALVGGRDYAVSTFNRATAGRRQVGSLVKPFTLVAALDADPALTLGTVLPDEPYEREIGGRTWRPANYDGRFRGEVTVREAVVHSLNVPSIHLAERLGLGRLQAFCRRVGLSGVTDHPSAALGAFEASPLQVAEAYGVFPGGGRRARAFLVRATAESGAPDPVRARPERVATEESVATALQALREVMVSGTGARAVRYGVSGAVGGKSGTTDGERDAWFAGFSPRIVAVVWVGHDRARPVGLPGSVAALPIWARFMQGTGTLTGAFPGEDGPLPRASEVGDEASSVEPSIASPDTPAPEEGGRKGLIRRIRESLGR